MEQLNVIHSNSFSHPKLASLRYLHLVIDSGPVKILQDAFNGLSELFFLIIRADELNTFPSSLFNAIANSIWELYINGWPENNNLNGMFTQAMRKMTLLHIGHVVLPQSKFYRLSASNFTAFRRLKILKLIDCGIFVIDEGTFDVIGRTLEELYLEQNWIVHFNLEMFRAFYETKWSYHLSFVDNNGDLECTCPLLEFDIMMNAMTHSWDMDCGSSEEDSMVTTCANRRVNDLATLCLKQLSKVPMRYIGVRLSSLGNETILVETNFTSKFRVILTDSIGMHAAKCADRAIEKNFMCLGLNESVIRLQLNATKHFDGIELISITAIPILQLFGTPPIHVMTVRRAFTEHDENWNIFHVIASVLGAIVGVCIGIGFCHTKKRHNKIGKTSNTMGQVAPYDYIEPSGIVVQYTKPTGDYAEVNEYTEIGLPAR